MPDDLKRETTERGLNMSSEPIEVSISCDISLTLKSSRQWS